MNWKNNRPEGWDAEAITKRLLSDWMSRGEIGKWSRLIEGGADAMLEVLKKQGTYCDWKGETTLDIPMIPGWVVVIPKEEK